MEGPGKELFIIHSQEMDRWTAGSPGTASVLASSHTQHLRHRDIDEPAVTHTSETRLQVQRTFFLKLDWVKRSLLKSN